MDLRYKMKTRAGLRLKSESYADWCVVRYDAL